MSPIVLALIVWTVISVPVALLVGAVISTLARIEPARVIVQPDRPSSSR